MTHPLNNIKLLAVVALLSTWGLIGELTTTNHRWFYTSLKVIGFSAATRVVVIDYQLRRGLRLSETQQDILDAASEVKTLYDYQIQTLHQQYQSQLQHYQTMIQQLQAKLQEAESQNLDELELEHDRLAIAYHANQRLEAQLAQERDEFERQVAAQRQEILHSEEALEQRLEQEHTQMQHQLDAQTQALEQRQADLEQREQEMIAQFQQQYDEANQSIEAEKESLQQDAEAFIQEKADEFATKEEMLLQQIVTLQKQVDQLRLPDLPDGTTPEDFLARDAIRCLQEFGIIVRSPLVRLLGEHRFELTFGVLPLLADDTIQTPIRTATEAHNRIKKDLLPALKMAVRGCETTPTVEAQADKRVRLVFDISGIDKAAVERDRKARAEAIQEPPPNFLVPFVAENPHVNLMGDSGYGKTTLINNIIGAMKIELGDGVEIINTNPKPDEDVDLTYLKYIGVDQAIFGLLEAATEIFYRVETNNTILRTNRDRPKAERQRFPKWKPLIYFFDEFNVLANAWNSCKPDVMDEILSQFERTLDGDRRYAFQLICKQVKPTSFAADLIRFCWRVGRSEFVKLLIAGQNLKARAIGPGVNIQDIRQQAYIYVGEAIHEGLENRIQDWHRDDLKANYEQRSQAVTAKKASKFYGLFVPKDGRPFFASTPPPNTYAPENSTVGISPPSESATLTPTPTVGTPNQSPNPSWRNEDSDLDTNSPTVPHGAHPHPWHNPNEGGASTVADPLDPLINQTLVETVLQTYRTTESLNKTIELVWKIPKDGKSKRYRAARWKLRKILYESGIEIPSPSPPYGLNPDDNKTFDQLINE